MPAGPASAPRSAATLHGSWTSAPLSRLAMRATAPTIHDRHETRRLGGTSQDAIGRRRPSVEGRQRVKLRSTDGMISSRIGLGTWALGGSMWGGTEERDALRTVRRAIDLGINLIDTAPVYGFGKSESLIGRAVAEHGAREHVLIATKGGLDWRAGQVFRNSSPDRIEAEVEASLRRLRTGYIDIYQVHWPDPVEPLERTAAVLVRLFERGIIRAIGVSNFSVAQLEAFRAVAPVHVVQSPYNLFERQIERDVLPYAEA